MLEGLNQADRFLGGGAKSPMRIRSRQSQKFGRFRRHDHMGGVARISGKTGPVRGGAQHGRQVRMQRTAVVNVHGLQPPAHAEQGDSKVVNRFQEVMFKGISPEINLTA